MTIQDKASGKILFYVLHYIFPNDVVKTEKYHNKNQFKRRVKQLQRYEKIGIVNSLVS